MTIRGCCFGLGVILAIGLLSGILQGRTPPPPVEESTCFYLRSLHFTAKGMEHWYSKKNGGLELLSGVPYEQLDCQGCHAAGCDRCHKSEKKQADCKIQAYSIAAAKNQSMCLQCHGREKAMISIDHKAGQEDVHVAKGMECADCHSQKEMHGDGMEYLSLKQPGAMDTQCENCHDDLKPTDAHEVHKDRLDCKACHVRHVVSCTNCHFDTFLEKGVRKALPVSGWVFLMNLNNKVTSASMQTFVVKGDKTFLMFAPHMSHSIVKKGRTCDACHATDTMRAAQAGAVKLTWLQDGKLHNQKGVIPVVDGVDYQCVYQNLKDDQWTPIANPAAPIRQYAAFGKPLTRQQLDRLAKKQDIPPPEIRPQTKK
jgi:hypothetical protein